MKKALLLAPALIGALAIASPALAGPVKLNAVLSGANETGGGDADGTGHFTAEADADSGDFCYTLAADKIAAPTAAHVHSGAAGQDGAPVVTLEVTGHDDEFCLAVPLETLKAIAAKPDDYYVNVHTADFPKGAVRGQLSK